MKKWMVSLGVLCLLLFANQNTATYSAEDLGHWPQWRGPFLNGVARTGAPVAFGDDKNVKWKVAIPGRGFSTPVIWGDRMFLTTAVPTGKTAAPVATASEPPPIPEGRRPGRGPGGPGGPGGGAAAGEEHRLLVMAVNRTNGKILWEREARVAVPHEGYHRTYGSFASNSPVTDGKYVYASFGSRGIYCFDFNGKLIWQKDPNVQMKMRLQFGEGTAPMLHGNMLVQTYDHEAGSFLLAIDKLTGKELWRAERDEQSSWSTPYIVDVKGQKQLIISATRRIRSYDPANGKLIWECAGLGTNVIPAPVQHNDSVIVMSGHRDPKLMSIRLGREGDVSGTNAVLWSHTRGTAYTPSPVLHENRYYTLSDNGTLSCFNATTGEPIYQQKRLPQADSFKASPIAADGKLYVASESGVVTILKMGDQFEVLATNTFEDHMFVSSPIVAAGELYLRSKTHLFCVAEKKS